MNVFVKPAKMLQGEITLPGDKSITHRAMMIGALSDGVTEIHGLSTAADPLSTLSCLRELGVKTELSGEILLVEGRGLGNLTQSLRPLDAGNSGTTIRLLTGILAAQKFQSVVTGDKSLLRRPMKRVIDPLVQMGARIESTPEQTAPLKIFPTSGLHGIEYELPIPSAQVKSAIIFAALHAEGVTTVHERIQTRDHTERMLGLDVQVIDGSRIIRVVGKRRIPARAYSIPGDLSAATYLVIAASLVPNSEVHLVNVGLNPTRTAILGLLQEMGAKIEIERLPTDDPEPCGSITVRSSILHNVEIDPRLIPSIIDEVPALAVAGAVARGRFQIRGARELRVKESDRISSLVRNLRRLGVEVEEYEDGFAFEGENELIPSGKLESFGDHRIAMAMGIVGLAGGRGIEIADADCVEISFPGFWTLLKNLSS